jgi:hypothetical protein
MRTGNRNKSRIVSQLIERYVGLIRQTEVTLTDDEVEHLARLMEGWQLEFSTALTMPAMTEVADIPEDLNVRKKALVIKLQDMGALGRLAVIEELEARGGPK